MAAPQLLDPKAALVPQLGREPGPKAYRLLVHAGVTELWEEGRLTLVELAQRLVLLERSTGETYHTRHRRAKKSEPARRDALAADMRTIALGRVAAAFAEREPEVREFRRRWLRNGLMKPFEATRWIENLSYMSDQGDFLGPETRLAPLGPVFLEEMARLSGRLGRAYGWPREHAAGFVLAAAAPSIPRVEVSRISPPANLSIPRLEISLAWPGVSEAELLRVYRQARTWANAMSSRPGEARWPRKPRPMTSNLQVKLAEFLAEHGNATTSWDELRRAWNRAGDGKRYKDPRSFARAAREAFGTVTGREAAKRPARRGRIARKKTPRGAKHPRRRQR